MRICVLSTAHTAQDARITHGWCRSLQKRYEHVSLVCRTPEPGARDMDGIRVVGLGPTPDGARRLPVLPHALRVAMAEQADFYICHDPDSLALGVAIKRLTGARLGYDAHELFREEILDRLAAAPRPLRALAGGLYRSVESVMLRHCDFMTTVSEPILRVMRASAARVPSALIYNCPWLSEFPERWVGGARQSGLVCYEGILHPRRRPRELLEAIGHAHAAGGARLKIIGEPRGEAAAILQAFTSQPDHRDAVSSTGWIHWTEVPRHLCDGVIGVVLLADLPNHRVSLPHKFFNYLAAGLAVIASDQSEPINLIIRRYDCGRIVSLDRPGELGRTLVELLRDEPLLARLRRNARQAFESEFNWENMEQRLYALMDRCT